MDKVRGQLIQRQGKNIHIQQMGQRGKTIVLMPGWDMLMSNFGPALPTADFAPLMRELSQNLWIAGKKQRYIQAGYTKDEIIKMASMPSHMGTLVAQMRALPDNLREVLALEAKLEIPIMLLSSGQMKKDAEHQKYLKEYLEKLGKHTKHVYIDGSTHIDIYERRESRKVICQEIDAFLKDLI